jgi:hypothetical protein
MLRELSKAAFDRDVGRLDSRLVRRRNWAILQAEYPVLDVVFRHGGAAPLRLRFTCDDWDEQPPAIELLREDGSVVQPSSAEDGGMFSRGKSIFNPGGHPITGKPFVCMRGSREFHTHSGHSAEVWDNYRGRSGNDLLGLLDQLWRTWKGSIQ